MKKVLFCLLSFFFFLSVSFAHVENVQFVGGTGGSKILELNVTEDKVDTNGVIYDKNASLVYEITYTNVSSTDKTVTDVKLPDTDIVLSYDFSDIYKNLVIKPGETIRFQYSIKALDNMTYEELSNLNENAQAELIFSSVDVSNPDTKDIVVVLLLTLVASVVIFRFVKDKRVFYACFIISAFLLSLNFSKKVIADDYEIVNINTGIKYIFSNLAPSCANLDYEGDFCIDWKEYGNRDKVNYLVMTDTKDMTDTYKIDDISFTLQDTYDVSEQQNEDVILGVYLADTEEESYLFLIGQDDGVIVPKDASYQFTSYDSVNNKNEYDFHYVKYLDFSHFYSNKTTNMEYMLTGLGTQIDMTMYDLSGFETSNVTNMKGMFTGFGEGAKTLNLDLSNFDTSNVADMSYMFVEFGFNSSTINLDLSNFDTSNVKNMEYMFYRFGVNTSDLNLDIYDWNTSNVEDMRSMFSSFNYLNDNDVMIDYFKKWDTSNVTDMSFLFGVSIMEAISANDTTNKVIIDITGLDTDNVELMSCMFGWNVSLSKIIGLENLDISNAVDISYMFMNVALYRDPIYLNVESFDTSKVEKFDGIFMEANLVDLNLAKWDLSSCVDVEQMFLGLKINNDFILGDWDFSEIDSFIRTFSKIDGVSYLDLSNYDFVGASSYYDMFTYDGVDEVPEVIDLSGSDWNEEATVTDMFKGVSGSTIYVKDEKAKAFIEKQAPDCTVLIKE